MDHKHDHDPAENRKAGMRRSRQIIDDQGDHGDAA